jgi:hypothetical protein
VKKDIMRRRIVAAFLATCMLLLGMAAAAPPATAVSAGRYCFQFENGLPYDELPAFLQLNTTDSDTGWVSVLNLQTNKDGCGTFTLSGDYASHRYVRVLALYALTGNLGQIMSIWLGTTPTVGPPGSGASSLGTGVVVCQVVTFPCQTGR